MRRGRVVAAAILWTAIVLIWALFVLGGQVYMCLGPLGVTEESCRAANGLPPLTDWDRFVRGWGPVAIVLIAGWASIAGIAAIPAIVRRRRQRGGL